MDKSNVTQLHPKDNKKDEASLRKVLFTKRNSFRIR